jgi:signal transduction histidine kinase
MDKYTLVPSKTKHPTKLEYKTLIEHLFHDLRGALTSVDVHIELMADGDMSLEEMYVTAEEIRPKSSHIVSIIESIDSLGSNSNTGQDFSLVRLLENLGEYLAGKHDQFTFNFKAEDVNVQNDRGVIYMQTFNLARNAVQQYRSIGKNSGEIIISAKEVTLTKQHLASLGRNRKKYSVNSPFVCVAVEDIAGGIKADPKKIFEVGQTEKNGQGIGLALMDYVCDFLHGFAVVESDSKGASFGMYFPKGYVRETKGMIGRTLESIPIVRAVYEKIK